MPSCCIYCRISLDATGEEMGVERQETECRQQAKTRGLDIVHVHVDNDISATTGKVRPAFEQLLKCGCEAIVTWHLDRLVRRTVDLERVLETELPVYSVTSGYLDLSNPAGRAVARTIVAWAQYEGEQKSERQKAWHRQRVARGEVWYGQRPFGFTRTGDLIDEESWLIADGYRRLLESESLRSIGKDWGVGTRGAKWTSSTVRDVLWSERNRGIVVPEDIWDLARKLLTARARGGRGAVGMLTGLARCGVCDGPCGVTPMYNRGGETKIKGYVCRVGHVSWARDPLEEYVGEAVAQVLERSRKAVGEVRDDPTADLQTLALDFASGRLTTAEFTAAAERVKRRAARPVPVWKPWSDLLPLERRLACGSVLEAVVLPPRGRGVRTPPRYVPAMLHWRTPA